jgi:hypothetical protein
MTTIKAWTNANKLIEWNYDEAADAKALWIAIVKTGRAPDTGDALSRAYLWGPARKRGEGPDKAWAA